MLASVNLTVQDTALPIAPAVRQIPVVLGCSTLGTAVGGPGDIVTCTSASQVRAAFGFGPLVTDASYIVQHGGTVRCGRLPSTNAGVSGAIAKTGTAGAAVMTIAAGTPNDRYSVRVECVSGGALGTATVRYSLDAWPDNSARSYSDPITVPVSGEVVLAGTGLTVDFSAALGAGDYYTFVTTAPTPAAADITALTTNNVLSGLSLPFRFVVLAGQEAAAADADTIASAFGTALVALQASGQRKIGIMGSGRDAAADQGTDFTYEGLNICAAYSELDVDATLPFTGLSRARIGTHIAVAARAAGSLLSTDPIRFASGPLPGVRTMAHDEFVEQNVDDLKITTSRSYPGESGVYLTNAWIKSADSSSVRYLQHATVIATACETVASVFNRYIGASLRTRGDGTISEADALDIERDVTATLTNVIGDASRNLGPFNAEGTRGHVSGFQFQIDRTVNLLATDTVQGELNIQPLGYPRTFNVTLGFRLLTA